MKIGLVLPSIPGYSETFFTNKIKGLQAQGHEIILFVNSSDTQTIFPCKIKTAPKLSGSFFTSTVISFLSLLKCLLFNLGTTLKLFTADKKDGISFRNRLRNIIISSHILSESLDWLHFGFGTMVLGRENVATAIGAKMAVSFRGYDHYVYPIKHKNCYHKLFQKKVKYHVLSEGMKKVLINNGIDTTSIVKITPAIDINLFSSQLNPIDNQGIVRVVSVSRLHWIKGLEYTLEALSVLKQQKIPFHYTIIGDGIEKEKLLFAVHQLGLSENVTFTGKLPPESVKEKLQSADLYLQYSIQEGFCNAVLEAQAMGKICIVSDAEGLTENVIDDCTGFVVPKRNADALANKIIEVLKLSDSQHKVISNNAVKRVKTEFNLDQQIAKFLDFYEINN